MDTLERLTEALQAILAEEGNGDYGERNEWTESDAFYRCQRIARKALGLSE